MLFTPIHLFWFWRSPEKFLSAHCQFPGIHQDRGQGVQRRSSRRDILFWGETMAKITLDLVLKVTEIFLDILWRRISRLFFKQGVGVRDSLRSCSGNLLNCWPTMGTQSRSQRWGATFAVDLVLGIIRNFTWIMWFNLNDFLWGKLGYGGVIGEGVFQYLREKATHNVEWF